MIIILEGENKTGKSTIAKHILDRYDFDVIKCSQPKGDPYVEYMKILKRIERSGRNTVIDRFVYGEFVYGPLYRGKSSLTKTQLRNIELKAMSLNAHVIYCHDTPENIERRFIEEKEEFADTKKIKKTVELFNKVIAGAILPVTYHQMQTSRDITSRYEQFQGGPDVSSTAITTKKIKRKSRAKWMLLDTLINKIGYWDSFSKMKTAVGNQRDPLIVLVGEQSNLKLKPEYRRFRQAFDFGVSSEYLFDEIKRTHENISSFMIMNSDSKELKMLAESRFDSSIIIALGRVADKKLDKLGVRYYSLNHPSYERRFHGKKHRTAKIMRHILNEF